MAKDGNKRSGRGLTSEELELWKQATQEAAPLANAGYPGVSDKTAQADELAFPLSMTERMVRRARELLPKAPSARMLESGNFAGVDGGSVKRLRRGDYPIDMTLDLHGLTREQARMALLRTLGSGYERGHRCVLVITGKGRRTEEGDEGGVLRSALPGWLNSETLRPHILAFCPAAAKHGGTGAFYVLLRRRRTDNPYDG